MEPTENRRNPDKRNRKYYDYTMLFMVVALIVIGILMISSISSYNAAKYLGDGNFYTNRQILYGALGFGVMIVLSLVDYHVYAVETPRRKWPLLIIPAYLFIAAAQAAVILLGRTDSDANGAVNGASRWIAVGGFKIQPGEFAKLFMIVIAAYWLCRIAGSRHKVRNTIIFLIAVSAVAVLALVESLTTAIVLFGIIFGMVFVCSRQKLLFAVLLALGILGAVLLVRYVKAQDTSSGNFRMRRVYEWIHLTDKDNDGQVKQGLYALASGGLFGKGFGQSAQKLGHIPEVHTDMIFAVIVEEMGLVGGAALLILFAVLLWRIAIVAINAQELFGTLLCYGVMLHIGLQVCINVAVVTGTIPSTGVTLPFISSGGSSLLALCAECGLVLNVSRNIGARRSVSILEDSGTAGANRRTDTNEERARGGLVSVKNEATGRKKPKRWPFGLLGGSEKSPDSRRSAAKSGKTDSGAKRGKTENSSESSSKSEASGGRKTTSAGDRNNGKRPAERSSDLRTSNVERKAPTDAIPSGAPQKYSIDVELGKPAKKDSE